MSTPFVILFAGPVGSSKTPIAHAISTACSLPILNNDTIRTEVQEDLGVFDQAVYETRRDKRLKRLIEHKKSFIYDASIDRKWPMLIPLLRDYRYAIISLDISKELLNTIWNAKGYDQLALLDSSYTEHQSFLAAIDPSYIITRITDSTFADRLTLCVSAVQSWIDNP